MNLLMHICCAPCAAYPVEELRFSGVQVTGFFFNHNIHPFTEFTKRMETVRTYAAKMNLEVIYRDQYLLDEFLEAVAASPATRCRYCYLSRLEVAAAEAAARGFDAFSTTLLYSRYQRHEVIAEIGEELGNRHGVRFHYADYRVGWQKGIQRSKELGLYRQQYCGCIYSERDRYQPRGC